MNRATGSSSLLLPSSSSFSSRRTLPPPSIYPSLSSYEVEENYYSPPVTPISATYRKQSLPPQPPPQPHSPTESFALREASRRSLSRQEPVDTRALADFLRNTGPESYDHYIPISELESEVSTRPDRADNTSANATTNSPLAYDQTLTMSASVSRSNSSPLPPLPSLPSKFSGTPSVKSGSSRSRRFLAKSIGKESIFAFGKKSQQRDASPVHGSSTGISNEDPFIPSTRTAATAKMLSSGHIAMMINSPDKFNLPAIFKSPPPPPTIDPSTNADEFSILENASANITATNHSVLSVSDPSSSRSLRSTTGDSPVIVFSSSKASFTDIADTTKISLRSSGYQDSASDIEFSRELENESVYSRNPRDDRNREKPGGGGGDDDDDPGQIVEVKSRSRVEFCETPVSESYDFHSPTAALPVFPTPPSHLHPSAGLIPLGPTTAPFTPPMSPPPSIPLPPSPSPAGNPPPFRPPPPIPSVTTPTTSIPSFNLPLPSPPLQQPQLQEQINTLSHALAIQRTRFDELTGYILRIVEGFEAKERLFEGKERWLETRVAVLEKEKWSWEKERDGLRWLLASGEGMSVTGPKPRTGLGADLAGDSLPVGLRRRSHTLPSLPRLVATATPTRYTNVVGLEPPPPRSADAVLTRGEDNFALVARTDSNTSTTSVSTGPSTAVAPISPTTGSPLGPSRVRAFTPRAPRTKSRPMSSASHTGVSSGSGVVGTSLVHHIGPSLYSHPSLNLSEASGAQKIRATSGYYRPVSLNNNGGEREQQSLQDAIRMLEGLGSAAAATASTAAAVVTVPGTTTTTEDIPEEALATTPTPKTHTRAAYI